MCSGSPTVAMCETASGNLFNNVCSALLDLQHFLSYDQLRQMLVPTLLGRVRKPTQEDQSTALMTIGKLGEDQTVYLVCVCVCVCVLCVQYWQGVCKLVPGFSDDELILELLPYITSQDVSVLSLKCNKEHLKLLHVLYSCIQRHDWSKCM